MTVTLGFLSRDLRRPATQKNSGLLSDRFLARLHFEVCLPKDKAVFFFPLADIHVINRRLRQRIAMAANAGGYQSRREIDAQH